MQPSLLVCLLAASVFGGQRRSSAERAPSLAHTGWPRRYRKEERGGIGGGLTSFGFGGGGM
jgi:hypothetical protein